MKLNCGAERYHYSMFNIGRSMFDIQSRKWLQISGRSYRGVFHHPGQNLPENLPNPIDDMRPDGNGRGGCRRRCIANMKASIGIYK